MLITKTSVAGHYHLAVARFYESIAKQMSEKDIANLYHDMMREIKNKKNTDGYEMLRQHSGGPAVPNDHAKQAFSHKSAFPRHVDSVHFIPRGDKWTCIYITPPKTDQQENREVQIWKRYGQPQPGGNVYLPADLFFEYDFFPDFTKAKVRCAQIIRKLEVLLADEGILSISHNAASETFAQLGRAREEMASPNTVGSESETFAKFGHSKKEIVLEKVLLWYISSYNAYTLVCYAVAYHTVS